MFQGYFTEESKDSLAIKKHKTYRTTAPPSGLVRRSYDHGCMMRHLCDATFTRAIFMHFAAIFTRFDTSLVP